MTDPCNGCGAKCCKYFCFEIDGPDTYAEFEDIRWFLCHEDVSVHVDEDGDWYISIMNPCKFLGPDDECTVYDRRPLICRKYDPDGCDRVGGDYGYQREFTTPEQVEAYAREVLGEEEFRRQKRNERRKLSRRLAKKTKRRKK